MDGDVPARPGGPQRRHEAKPLIPLRRLAVKEGRAMVRVRRRATGELVTAGVCPACWNIRERRRDLLIQLSKMGLEVAHREDLLDGTYRPGRQHAPGCRHAALQPDPWKRFEERIRPRRP